MSGIDDVEYANLAEQVRRIELLVDADTRSDSSYLLKSFLHNAKSRMEEIRHEEIRAEDEKKDQKSKESASVVQLAQMEHRLNAQEKQQYSGFLQLDYFTKANFDELEDFYEQSWEKLSESGKNQMSHRVWEGVRQGEYDFSELPENVRKRESERLYEQLTVASGIHGSLANIPQQDRVDFIHAHESGDDKKVAQILSRETFSMNVSTTSSTEDSLRESSVSSKKEAEDRKNSDTESKRETRETDKAVFGGFTLAEASEAVKPNIPDLAGSRSLERS